MIFRFYRFRFHFRADGPLFFPPWRSSNILRGAFGTLLQPAFFSPERVEGPSGLHQPPRPFVFRASHLDGRRIEAGAAFSFDLHLFQVDKPPLREIVDAFSGLYREGLGPGRAPVELTGADQLRLDGSVAAHVYNPAEPLAPPEALNLTADAEPIRQVTIRFLTPTELKTSQRIADRPEFGFLFARLRDRLSTLRELYGEGPLDIDFRSMGARAGAVRIAEEHLSGVDVYRRSSRTGQTHPIGGFFGEVSYVGDLAEFVPYVSAGKWTGVGRQTVWGKGEIEVRL